MTVSRSDTEDVIEIGNGELQSGGMSICTAEKIMLEIVSSGVKNCEVTNRTLSMLTQWEATLRKWEDDLSKRQAIITKREIDLDDHYERRVVNGPPKIFHPEVVARPSKQWKPPSPMQIKLSPTSPIPVNTKQVTLQMSKGNSYRQSPSSSNHTNRSPTRKRNSAGDVSTGKIALSSPLVRSRSLNKKDSSSPFIKRLERTRSDTNQGTVAIGGVIVGSSHHIRKQSPSTRLRSSKLKNQRAGPTDTDAATGSRKDFEVCSTTNQDIKSIPYVTITKSKTQASLRRSNTARLRSSTALPSVSSPFSPHKAFIP